MTHLGQGVHLLQELLGARFSGFELAVGAEDTVGSLVERWTRLGGEGLLREYGGADQDNGR